MNNYKYYFLFGLLLVNAVALTQWDPFYLGAVFSFIYMIEVPGLLLLPFFVKKPMATMLGFAISAAISIFLLMVGGLALNTVLPFIGIEAPLTTIPLLCLFDIATLVLLVLNFSYEKTLPLAPLLITKWDKAVAGISLFLPVLACLGAIHLNDGGGNVLSIITLGLVIFLALFAIVNQQKLHSSSFAIALFMTALTFLLMNSMRGWFITGHDILLEYHVFTLVESAQRWSMALYHDPYMACLSLTIFPVYIQSFINVNGAYIFKFFMQFIGAIPVVIIYYICREYISDTIAFLAGFIYITFPTFMTDMAFLNRQNVAFMFFGALIFAILNAHYFTVRSRQIMLLLLATGMVLSHYSTSYIAIAVLAGAWVIDLPLRGIMKMRWPKWFARATDKLGSKAAYASAKLLTLPFVISILLIIMLWSVVITQTSSNLVDTLRQIGTNVIRPFSIEQSTTAVNKYSILPPAAPAPAAPLEQFIQQNIQQVQNAGSNSDYYPLSLTTSYSTTAIPEPSVPLTPIGAGLESLLKQNLGDLFNNLKQAYAKIVQGLILLGLAGFLIGIGFRKNLLRRLPAEYISLSLASLVILAGQTILPPTAIDYGLLRLFQQNLIILALPIMLALAGICSFFTRSVKAQSFICAAVILFFFLMLSGMFPQLTGGGRPPLTLNNYGFYYDAYFTHAQELSAFRWFVKDANVDIPIQSDRYFSAIKMITYTGIAPLPGLLPETIHKNDYVYLNYDNAQTGDVIEYINGSVVYYHFPVEFLDANKDLIYNNGGSEIYK